MGVPAPRQFHHKAAAFVDLRLEADCPAVGERDLVRDKQTQTRAFGSFGAEEQTEGFLAGFLIHADAVVFDFKEYAVGLTEEAEGNLVSVFFFVGQTGVQRGPLD